MLNYTFKRIFILKNCLKYILLAANVARLFRATFAASSIYFKQFLRTNSFEIKFKGKL